MNTKRKTSAMSILGAAVIVVIAGYGWHTYAQLRSERDVIAQTLSETQDALTNTQNQNKDLEQKLADAQTMLGNLEKEFTGVTTRVNTLQKIQSTDKELLAKYSKIYFLNENYIPSSLVDISSQFLPAPTKPLQIHSQVNPFLFGLLDKAREAGLHLQVVSAYRSFGQQSGLKASYKVTYGAGTANSFSADQGYSEHQLGTAVDFTTPTSADTTIAFAKTPEYTWLQSNAYLYGFVLSYPEKNTFYTFEPWHWRFVGTTLATRLHNEGKNFYDLDQRDIDNFLVNLFD